MAEARPSIFTRLKRVALALRRDVLTVWLAARDPRVSWHAKALAAVVAAYALSPIDLIPDFIPVLGYVDDLVLVPLGIVLVLKLIPAGLLAELRRAVDTGAAGLPGASRSAAAVIVILWIAGIAGALYLVWRAVAVP